MKLTITAGILPWGVVHHRDKDKQNNRPENLQLLSGEHARIDKIGTAKDLAQVCVYCSSSHVVRTGGIRNNKQRFRCVCGKSWSVSGTDLMNAFLTRLKRGTSLNQDICLDRLVMTSHIMGPLASDLIGGVWG
jgi:hypothetical protein